MLIGEFMAVSAFSQLNSDGYYRIQNTSSYSRFLTISNDRVDETNKNAISNGNEGNIFGLRTIKNPVSDPSSIIYISRDETSKSKNAYIIEAQGINPLKFMKDNGTELKIYPNNEDDYFIYGSRGAITLYLVDNNGSDGYIKVARKNVYPQNQTWKLLPINKESNSYFGITPDENLKIGDKYYTTLFASFPFKHGEGLKVYYIDKSNLNAENPIAELKEITGIVPAATPVIIECSSIDPANNRVELIDMNNSPEGLTDNLLKGVYFCYVKMKATNANQENAGEVYQNIKNVVSYEADKMRVLGIKDGKLALINANDYQLVITDKGKYLPANKAYFPITPSIASATANGILLLDPDSYETGISNIVVDDTDDTRSGTYSISGIKINGNCSMEELPKGIYIINGKKIVK